MQMNPDPPVQRGRRRVSTEQKLVILQQWQAGTFQRNSNFRPNRN